MDWRVQKGKVIGEVCVDGCKKQKERNESRELPSERERERSVNDEEEKD